MIAGGISPALCAEHATHGAPPSARAALWYARRGLRVHPLRPGSKAPVLTEWPRRATTDAARIADWWRRWPTAGVGIATGDGIFVVDVDPRHGGDVTLLNLEAEHGGLPATWRCQTAGGGAHVYLRAPSPLRNRVGVWPGIDVRAAGGYVVAPPTILDGGRSYMWESEHAPHEVTLAAAPAWLVECAVRSDARVTSRLPEEWAELVRLGAREGARNDAAARLAGYLLRRRPAPRVVLELVRAWNESRCRPPLSDEEIIRTVDSVARREAERRFR